MAILLLIRITHVISGYCSPRYESENRVGVYNEKCQMQLSSVLALYSGAILNHLFVIFIYKTH